MRTTLISQMKKKSRKDENVCRSHDETLKSVCDFIGRAGAPWVETVVLNIVNLDLIPNYMFPFLIHFLPIKLLFSKANGCQ